MTLSPGDWPSRLWFWLFCAAFLYSPWIDTRPGQGNVASDLAAIESLVERGTFFINDSTFIGTIDKFKRGDLYFSQKSPIFHLVAAVPYFALNRMGFTLGEDTALCMRVLTFFIVILPMGLLLWLIFNHPWMELHTLRKRLGLPFGFALGSLLTPFAVTLNHYVPAAACLMIAVNALYRTELGPRGSDLRSAVPIGFWIAASLACDIPPAFILGAGLAAWWAWKARARLSGLVAGAAPLILIYAALNFHIVGSPLPPNLHEQEMLYYEGSYWSELKAKAEGGEPGFYQASYARRLLHSTVGHKGLYWMMPPLAIATLGGFIVARRRGPSWGLALAPALFPLVSIAIVMVWAFDLSGGAYGIRHVFATIPPLYCVLAHPAFPRSNKLSRIALAGWGWSCLIAWIGVYNPWSHNTLSAFPPLENVARFTLDHSERLSTAWIPGLIDATSVRGETGYLDLGLEHMSAGRLREAENALARSVLTKPDFPLPYYHLGIVQDMRGQPLAALRTYERLLKLEPENIGAWNNRGLFALKAGRAIPARQAYERSMMLAPDNLPATRALLRLDSIEGLLDSQSPRLKRALEVYPRDPFVLEISRLWGTANIDTNAPSP